MAQMVKSVKNLKHGEEVEGQWGQEERSERKDWGRGKETDQTTLRYRFVRTTS
jgi:hypothetical protein